MIPAFRERFNREFTPARHAAFRAAVERQCGVGIDFMLSETPCFFPASLMARLVQTSQDLIAQLLGNPEYRRAADDEVPPPFRLQGGESRPTFVQVDFGLVRGADGIEGRLVELQAFPSLYGFQAMLAETARAHYGFADLTPYLGGLDTQTYRQTVGQAIAGAHDPAHVVLLEIDPDHQKTLPDFRVTETWWGVRAIDIGDVVPQDGRLFARRDGRLSPIARIYNRMIPDELQRLGRQLPFDLREDYGVEWAGGPDWYFRLSKYSIPWLRHPWVPETHFLSDLDRLPADRDRWILKPLYSFAGGGIVFAPSDAALAAIPQEHRRHYILQERIAFEPVIETPYGPTQAEIRIMLVRDGDGYRAVLPLVRMGRGRMMGVDHNKGLQWVGAAAALIAAADGTQGG
jgi:hypothetical protein